MHVWKTVSLGSEVTALSIRWQSEYCSRPSKTSAMTIARSICYLLADLLMVNCVLQTPLEQHIGKTQGCRDLSRFTTAHFKIHYETTALCLRALPDPCFWVQESNANYEALIVALANSSLSTIFNRLAVHGIPWLSKPLCLAPGKRVAVELSPSLLLQCSAPAPLLPKQFLTQLQIWTYIMWFSHRDTVRGDCYTISQRQGLNTPSFQIACDCLDLANQWTSQQ